VEPGEGTPVYDDDRLNEQDHTPVAGSSKRKLTDNGRVPEVSYSIDNLAVSVTNKKFLCKDIDSDELDDDDFVPAVKRVKESAATSRAVSTDYSASNASGSGLRGIGEFMPCGECGERFTVVSKGILLHGLPIVPHTLLRRHTRNLILPSPTHSSVSIVARY
jgi:hypothetical protein